MKKYSYLFGFLALVCLAGCASKQVTILPAVMPVETEWKTFSMPATGRNLSFRYPADYSVETDNLSTIWIKKVETEYRFDAGYCGWETQANKQPEVINGKTFFKVVNTIIPGEKYFYYHNYPNLDSCIIFQASAANDSWYIKTFEDIIHSITFN